MNRPALSSLFAPMLVISVVASSALAVKPGQWLHETEADFQASELDHTVVTNLGRVELSRSSELLAELQGSDTIINDLAMIGDDLYLAAGPEGRLLRWRRGQTDELSPIAEFKGEQLFALATQDDALWLAVSGPKSRLEKRIGDKIQQTIELPGVRYVWDIAVIANHLWLATGTEGQVLMINLDVEKPQHVVALDTQQANILCLGFDADSNIYAGTDTDGLVYRIAPPSDDDPAGDYQVFVMYDAAEPEIGALLVRPDGVVYAGTADANEARPGRLAEASDEPSGTPEPGEAQPTQPDGEPDDEPSPPDEPPGVEPQPQPMPEKSKSSDKSSDKQKTSKSSKSDQPTPQQYDQLRKVVADRLKQLRAGAKDLALKPGSGKRLSPRRPEGGSPAANAEQSEPREGNAIYRIDADGFVRECFRESVMILSIVEHNHQLLVATGNEGQIYRVDPDGQKFTVLADLDPLQATSMRVIDDQIIVATANPAQLVRLGGIYALTGSFTADPLDATQISLWGRLSILAMIPDLTGVSVQTRSGNVGDPEAGYWSPWSDPQPVQPQFSGQPVYLPVDTAPARFIQYRLLFVSDGSDTPSVAKVVLKYLTPNIAPTIESLTAAYPEPSDDDDEENTPPRMSTVNLEWTVNDPNADTLTYTLETRKFGAEDQPFIKLEDELTESTYEWDTRSVPDGLYEVRLTADDSPDNVPDQSKTARRISPQIVVDNSPPDAPQFTVEPAAASAKVTAQIVDGLSAIREIRYSVDGSEEWKPLLPADMIYDSTDETVSFTIPDLSPGAHVVSLRATDALGNSRYVSHTLTVPQ